MNRNRYFKIFFLFLLICESLVNGSLLNALTLLEHGGLLLGSGHQSLQGHASQLGQLVRLAVLAELLKGTVHK